MTDNSLFAIGEHCTLLREADFSYNDNIVKYPKDKVVIFAVDDTFMQTYFTKIWAYTGKS
jgi:hypothetical protein